SAPLSPPLQFHRSPAGFFQPCLHEALCQSLVRLAPLPGTLSRLTPPVELLTQPVREIFPSHFPTPPQERIFSRQICRTQLLHPTRKLPSTLRGVGLQAMFA